MAWRNMRGGWQQNATQGFSTRAQARAACGVRPIDPPRPHLRWKVARVTKVSNGDGTHHWTADHFVKTVPVEWNAGTIHALFTCELYQHYAVMLTDTRLGYEIHHIYATKDEFLADIILTGAN